MRFANRTGSFSCGTSLRFHPPLNSKGSCDPASTVDFLRASNLNLSLDANPAPARCSEGPQGSSWPEGDGHLKTTLLYTTLTSPLQIGRETHWHQETLWQLLSVDSQVRINIGSQKAASSVNAIYLISLVLVHATLEHSVLYVVRTF